MARGSAPRAGQGGGVCRADWQAGWGLGMQGREGEPRPSGEGGRIAATLEPLPLSGVSSSPLGRPSDSRQCGGFHWEPGLTLPRLEPLQAEKAPGPQCSARPAWRSCLSGQQTLAEATWLLKSSPGPREQRPAPQSSTFRPYSAPAVRQAQPGGPGAACGFTPHASLGPPGAQSHCRWTCRPPRGPWPCRLSLSRSQARWKM